MLFAKVLVVIFVEITAIISTVPPLPRKCKLSDSGCLKSVAQQVLPTFVAGVPELNINPLDVMFIKINKLDVSGLKLTVTNVYIKGLKNAVIKGISFNMRRRVLKLTYHADLYMNSKYKASGRMLVLPISGDGDMTVDLKNIQIEMTIPFEIVKNKDGKDVLELTNYQYNYEVKGGARYDFSNLFDGNQQLGNTLVSFMNKNWKLLSVEFGRPMLEKVQKRIFDALKTYLGSRPLESFVDN